MTEQDVGQSTGQAGVTQKALESGEDPFQLLVHM